MSDTDRLAALLHEIVVSEDTRGCGGTHSIGYGYCQTLAARLHAAGVRVTGDAGPEPAGFSISMSGEPYWSEGPGAPKIVRAVGNHRKGYRGVARFDCPHRHPTTGLDWEWGVPGSDGFWEPVITTVRTDNLVVSERERFADWLAAELAYPFDVKFATPPPVSIDEMAAAWHRIDPEPSLGDWRETIAIEMDEP